MNDNVIDIDMLVALQKLREMEERRKRRAEQQPVVRITEDERPIEGTEEEGDLREWDPTVDFEIEL